MPARGRKKIMNTETTSPPSGLASPACSLILGDCRDVLRGTGPWDMVLTSPPYNAKKPYDGYLDDVPEDEYWSMIRDVAALTWDECRAGAYALWNVPLWWGKRPKKYRPDKYREAMTPENIKRLAAAVRDISELSGVSMNDVFDALYEFFDNATLEQVNHFIARE